MRKNIQSFIILIFLAQIFVTTSLANEPSFTRLNLLELPSSMEISADGQVPDEEVLAGNLDLAADYLGKAEEHLEKGDSQDFESHIAKANELLVEFMVVSIRVQATSGGKSSLAAEKQPQMLELFKRSHSLRLLACKKAGDELDALLDG